MKTNEGRVYFSLDGDYFEPDDITALLGIEPTKVMRKGESASGTIYRRNSWQYSTDNVVNDYIDVYEMSADIVNQLRPLKVEIAEARRRFGVSPSLRVVLMLSSDEDVPTPAIGFDPEVVQFLSEVGAFIDVDLYRT